MKKQKGFSLIELLIVVAIILIIAAIAIPNLLKSRMAANESSAVGSLRTYNTAFVTYAAQCPALGFPKDLPTIGPGIGDCTAANIVDNVLGLAAPVKSGYTFVYTPAAAINGVIFTCDGRHHWSAHVLLGPDRCDSLRSFRCWLRRR